LEQPQHKEVKGKMALEMAWRELKEMQDRLETPTSKSSNCRAI
jgi:hypothetical protein